MAQIKIRYFVTKKGANTPPRHYWQPKADLVAAGWKTQRLDDNLTTAIRQAENWNDQLDNWRNALQVEQAAQAPDSIENIVKAYKKSPRYTSKVAKTRHSYDQMLDLLTKWCGDFPAAALSAPLIEERHALLFKRTPAQADAMIRVFRIVWNWANDTRMINLANPSAAIQLRHKAEKGKPWHRDQLDHICNVAIAMGYPSIALAIRCQAWHGQRQGDILAMTRTALKQGVIRQSKTGAEVPLNWDPKLLTDVQAAIARHPKATHVIINDRTGQPWTGQAFGKAFAKIRKQAAETRPDVANLICKDLRHTAVLELAEAGAELPEIATVTGHSLKSAQEILDRYLVRTDALSKRAQNRRLEGENK